jgi:purine-binding chemotaxis protein CheW
MSATTTLERSVATKADVTRLAGKYMGFQLGKETFGVEILKVQEIIGMLDVTAVPRTPDFVRGVINLRGRVIPVVDLRRKFNLTEIQDTELTCIVVVQVTVAQGQVTMGVIVDQVSEVMNITADNVEPTPSLGHAEAEKFLLGIGKFNQTVVLLLDVDRILSHGEWNLVGAMGDED